LIRRWLALFVLATSTVCMAQQLRVAAAADLNYALRDIAGKFESETGKKTELTFGSSGNFFTAIENGAPYDVFLSADMDYAETLQAIGLTVPGTLYEYAVGKIVVWVPTDSKIDVWRGLSVLTDPSIKKIAIANPRHAPYGRAAVAALKSAGLYDAVSGKLVLGENIAQTAQFVQTGNADIGIIALSLAMAPPTSHSGRYWTIPTSTYPPIRQGAVVLKVASDQALARQFLEFFKSPYARQVFERYGFSSPQASTK